MPVETRRRMLAHFNTVRLSPKNVALGGATFLGVLAIIGASGKLL